MNITRFKDGQPLNQETLNAPLIQIEAALNVMELKQNSFEKPSAITIYNVPCYFDVAIGDVVYYDEKGYAAKALAVYSTNFDINGELLAHKSAYPIGIVTDKDGTLATVVTKGTFKPSDVLNKIFTAEGITPGEYYLSGSDAGSLSKEAATMPIRVLEYISEDLVFVNISQPPTNYHKHTYTVLNKGWISLSDTERIEYTREGFVPQYKYAIEKDAETSYLVSNYGSSFVFVYDGLINVTNFRCYDNNIFIDREPLSGTHEYLMFANLPCLTEQPILRAIKSSSGRLKVTNDHGIITLDLDTYSIDPEIKNSDTAISDIQSDGTVVKTNIISSIVTDTSIACIKGSNGEIALSANGSSKRIYPDTVSLDLSLVTTINDMIVYVLPSGSASSILYKINIDAPPQNFVFDITPFIEPIGISGAYTLNTTMDITFVPEGDSTGILYEEAAIKNLGVSSAAIIAAQKKYFIPVNGLTNISTAGTLYVKLSAATVTGTQTFSGFGVTVNIKASGQ